MCLPVPLVAELRQCLCLGSSNPAFGSALALPAQPSEAEVGARPGRPEDEPCGAAEPGPALGTGTSGAPQACACAAEGEGPARAQAGKE